MSRGLKAVTGMTVSLVALGAGAGSAVASFPGGNGEIAFLRSPTTQLGPDDPAGDLYVMEADGSRKTPAGARCR